MTSCTCCRDGNDGKFFCDSLPEDIDSPEELHAARARHAEGGCVLCHGRLLHFGVDCDCPECHDLREAARADRADARMAQLNLNRLRGAR